MYIYIYTYVNNIHIYIYVYIDIHQFENYYESIRPDSVHFVRLPPLNHSIDILFLVAEDVKNQSG